MATARSALPCGAARARVAVLVDRSIMRRRAAACHGRRTSHRRRRRSTRLGSGLLFPGADTALGLTRFGAGCGTGGPFTAYLRRGTP
jgi:hypothetical protein